MTNLDSIKKQRHYFTNKVHVVKAVVFPVVMYGNRCESWTIKNRVSKNWCFRTVVLEKILNSPLDCKEIKPVNPKENHSWIFIGGTYVEAEAPVLRPPDSKSRLTGKDSDTGKDWRWKRREDRGQDCWMASLTQCTWVWANSGKWWTGKPGVLQSMGSQRVEHAWAT